MKVLLLLCLTPGLLWGQTSKKKPRKPPAPFHWVNPLPEGKYPFLKHATFRSPSMDKAVGYCIHLPKAYRENPDQRFPVVYLLHGGRPGSELKMAGTLQIAQAYMAAGKVRPMIYVLPNGGKVSHYNTPQFDSLGEDVFVKELIPHIDKTYRTLAKREGRALEGFSQGGRGTARIMFRYPELFASCAPGGGGFATEKKISESGGYEHEKLFFGKGVNAWDRASVHAAARTSDKVPALNILVYVGDKGFNYENNLEYMKHLESLDIPFKRLIVPGAPHSSRIIYEKKGLEIMRFHAGNLAR